MTSQHDREWLEVGRDTMFHRGPDGAGEWWSDDGRVGLAHRRLSIFDLSPLGHQPMHLRPRGLSIVFNGEIYNFLELRKQLEQRGHIFRSHSDTEVLLAAYSEWGTDCLGRLVGMFAFAIHDEPNQTLFLARDRVGEKPLFYSLRDGAIYFASELKALLANPALPRRIDHEALDCYLALGYVPGDRCILEGYRKLKAAHALTFDLSSGTARSWRYWQPPELTRQQHADEAGLVEELETLLEDAVGGQLRADVPVGVLLSGGVDSSLVTAAAVRRSSQVRTFSIGFPGHDNHDETEFARKIAHHFGTDHTELMAEPASAELIPELARQFDEPMADSSMIPTYLVSRLVREQCTVALGGDGGDELFGGYRRYSRLLWMQRRLDRVPEIARKSLAWGGEHLLPVGVKRRNYLMALGVDLSRDLPVVGGYFDATSRRRLMRRYGAWPTSAERVLPTCISSETDLLQRATRTDFANYLVDDLLVKVDRASMLNSLEVRSPFLDHRLVEFAFGRVPVSLKATATQTKILPKYLTERLLPADFDRERKQGFSIPISEWLKAGPFRELFWDVLSSPDCLFDRNAISRILKGQDKGRQSGDLLFALVQFELWRTMYQAYL
jgi:asparagine synthase (glutamine-hydrolysing)